MHDHTRQSSHDISLRVRTDSGTRHLPSPKEVVDTFSSFFSECYLPLSARGCPDLRARDTDQNASTDTCSLFTITVSDVIAAINKLRPKRSAGADEIPLFIIKGCCSLIAPALAYVFNLSLNTVVFPELWKKGIVAPFFKTGDACNPSTTARFLCCVAFRRFLKELCAGASLLICPSC